MEQQAKQAQPLEADVEAEVSTEEVAEDALETEAELEEASAEDVADDAIEESAEEEAVEDYIEHADEQGDLRVLEALLFASAEPLTTNAIRERLGQETDVGGLLMQLKEKYEGAGVQLVEMEGSWAFRTASDLGDSLMITKEVQRKLSRAAMETLTIIAYHQPVTRAEIENIRGVATSKGTIDVLMECGWVKPGRRRETPGRPLTWLTTTAFMDHFGLESMSDLPGLDELKASGLLDRRPAIDTIPGTADMFGDDMEDVEADAADDGDDDYDDDDNYDEVVSEASGDDETVMEIEEDVEIEEEEIL